MRYLIPITLSLFLPFTGIYSQTSGEERIDNIGQQILAEQCFRCHDGGMWHDLKTDRNGWLSVIYRMVGRGGVWTPEQINILADYLFLTFPEEEGN